MNQLKFEELPSIISLLVKEINELKLICQNSLNKEASNVEKFYSVSEAAEFLNLSIPTIYAKVCRREIPFIKKGKRLYFSSFELTDYLKNGLKEDDGAEKFLKSKKGAKNGK